MKKALFIYLLFVAVIGKGQHIRHPVEYKGYQCNCGAEKEVGVAVFKNTGTQKQPFSNIFQLTVKRTGDKNRFSTVSFISADCLVAARHSVESRDLIDFIELSGTVGGVKTVLLNKSDFEIYYYTERLTKFWVDVAIIKIINKTKLKKIYSSHFGIAGDLPLTAIDSLYMAGYPFKKFAINKIAPDTLAFRVVSFETMKFNRTRTMIALDICSCPGDSGGPVWYKKQGMYYLLAIIQGRGWEENASEDNSRSTAVFLNENLAGWIRTVVSGKGGNAFNRSSDD